RRLAGSLLRGRLAGGLLRPALRCRFLRSAAGATLAVLLAAPLLLLGLGFPLLAWALRPLGDIEPAVLVERVFRPALRGADAVAARLVATLPGDLRSAVLRPVRQRPAPTP